MKKSFSEYYPLSSKKKKTILQSAVFVFDANVLLELYCYSESTRDEVIDLLKKVQEHVWLPHQFALEYQRGRVKVIEKQARVYKELINALDTSAKQVKKEIDERKHRHPFLDMDDIWAKIANAVEISKKEIKKTQDKHPDWILKDPVRDELDKIFKNKIGSPCDDLDKVEKDGMLRYSKRIPPGYDDEGKDSKDYSGNRKFGDWIGWYQMMEMAKEKKRPIIFITDDGTSNKKSDWWQKSDSKTIGPRPELIKEMSDIGVDFHMYNTESFIKYVKPVFKIKKTAEKEISEKNKAFDLLANPDGAFAAVTVGVESSCGFPDEGLETGETPN